jgi:ribose 5-phosphate isomerase B
MTQKVAIASDHAGYHLKEFLKLCGEELGVEWVDLGTNSPDTSVDYPDFGKKVADAVADGGVELGVALCGSGVGISIAVNRNPKIRGALCANATTARLARMHNDANVLCMGERLTGTEMAKDILKTFLTTKFEGGRHCGRVEKLTSL